MLVLGKVNKSEEEGSSSKGRNNESNW